MLAVFGAEKLRKVDLFRLSELVVRSAWRELKAWCIGCVGCLAHDLCLSHRVRAEYVIKRGGRGRDLYFNITRDESFRMFHEARVRRQSLLWWTCRRDANIAPAKLVFEVFLAFGRQRIGKNCV